MNKTAILLGSKPASVAAFLLLRKHGWNIQAVVASPFQDDWIPSPSLYEIASKHGVRTVNKQSELESEKVDLVISYMCRSLVTKRTLSLGKYALNFHAAPLPKFGGWAFYNVAILEESGEYGCSCHIMDQSFDTGALVKVRRFSINPKNETAVSLERKSQIEMLFLFDEIISSYEVNQEITSEAQDPDKMRYMNAKDFAKLKEIPLNASPEEADKIARAFWYPPYEIAYYKLPNGTKLEVIPEIAKSDLAHKLHENDLADALISLGLRSIK